MISFLDRLFGWRFVVWRVLVILSVILYFFATFNGAFSGWTGARKGPFSLVTGFAIFSFLILIPAGYILANCRAAIALRYVGWIYFIFIFGWLCILMHYLYELIVCLMRGSEDIIMLSIQHFAILSLYSGVAIPLSVVLFVLKEGKVVVE